MKFKRTTLDAYVLENESDQGHRVRIEAYSFTLDGTSLPLAAHKVIERAERDGPFQLSDKRWMVSEPRTGLRVLHEREYLTRKDAVDSTSEVVAAVGLGVMMEKIMLAMSNMGGAEVKNLSGDVLEAGAKRTVNT